MLDEGSFVSQTQSSKEDVSKRLDKAKIFNSSDKYGFPVGCPRKHLPLFVVVYFSASVLTFIPMCFKY